MLNQKKKAKSKKEYVPCHVSHKPLVIKMGGKEYQIHGGSCLKPVVKTDVIVGLDSGFSPAERAYPWYDTVAFKFPITDMSVPSNVSEFKKLLQFLKDSLVGGKSVFVGCIGGHGRTGLVFSALVTYMTGEKDSITYTRDNYCEKAVESSKQVSWLTKHFGVVKVAGYKDTMFSSYQYPSKYGSSTYTELYGGGKKSSPPSTIYMPIPNSPLSLHWNDNHEKESH